MLVCENGPADNEIALNVAVEPEFEIVTICCELDVFTCCGLKTSELGLMVSDGDPRPVLLRGIECGDPAALSEKVMEPSYAPTPVGVNVAVTVQVPFGTSVAPEQVSLVMEYPLVMVTAGEDEITRLLPPVFVTVNVCAALVVFTACPPKLYADGEAVNAGTVEMPVPLSATVCGLPAALSLTWILAAGRSPVPCGVKAIYT